MLENGSFNYYNGSVTETEQEQQTAQQVESAQSVQTESQFDENANLGVYDDYSMTANYTEQSNYESAKTESETDSDETETESYSYAINLPNIQKEEQEVVTLTKTRQKIALSPRMKIIMSVFSVIMASLLFLIIFNFASLGSLNLSISERQNTVSEMNARISDLQAKYNELSDDEDFLNQAVENNYVIPDESNTVHLNSSDFYKEKKVEKLPSNWFNDFCDFLSHLFG